MTEVSTSEICTLFSLTSTDILNELAYKNIAVRITRGLYDLATSTKNYIIYFKSINKESTELRKGDLTENKLRQTAAQASLSELELARRSGELVPVKDVIIKVASEFGRVRDRLLNIPGKLAHMLYGLKTKESEAKLKTEIWEALTELHQPDDGSVFTDQEPDVEQIAESFDLQNQDEIAAE